MENDISVSVNIHIHWVTAAVNKSILCVKLVGGHLVLGQ